MKIFLLVSLLLFWGDLQALVLDAGAKQSYETTSNILKVPEDGSGATVPVEESISITGIYLKVNEDAAGLTANLEININYMDFVNNYASDVTRSSLKTDANWIIRKGRYSWYLRDTFSQTRIDTSLNFNENNIQDVNELVTGPVFDWEVSGNSLKLSSYVYAYDYSETDNDNSSVITNLIWSRNMSAGKELYLKYTTKVVSYESNSLLNDYDQSTLGVGFKYSKRVDAFDVFFGKSALSGDAGNDYTTSSFLYKRKTTRLSNISLGYAKTLSDNNNAIDSLGTPLNGVYIEKVSSINYQTNGITTGYDLRLEEKVREDTVEDDEDIRLTKTFTMYINISDKSRLDLSYIDSENQIDSGSLQNYQNNMYTSKLSYIKRLNNKMSFVGFLSEEIVVSTIAQYQYNDKRIGFTFSISR
ncbi:MAG: hypothetical protein OEY29_03530 [Gammaproteobacteria bacterium]|nr:hypothetical protein [Gammaproteobacteria bacterium]